MKEKEKRPFKERLLNKYRLVVLNEDTYEEKLSYKLNKLNIFLLIALISITLVITTVGLIAFTSVKEYIPGYDSTVLRQKAIKNIELLDSLQLVVNKNQTFINSVGAVILGEVTEDELVKKNSLIKPDISELDFKTNKEDSLLRSLVQKEDRFNTIESANPKVEYVLYSPISGKISSGFDTSERHYGVDVPAVTNTPVKAASDGRVVFSEWTIDTGFVIILEHSFNLISVYKHNSSGLITQGDYVKSGQAIALSGNTGELTTGPHLHFELWSNGNPVDPLEYISFE
ncbi:M23 family metallopeptidase [Flavobacteriaceae bacterium]|nr:M23 family metallopeptidase [Flavobacteriaceae bacterium]